MPCFVMIIRMGRVKVILTNDEEDEEDDDDQLPVTIPTISKAKPPVYSDWIDWYEIRKKLKKMLGSNEM